MKHLTISIALLSLLSLSSITINAQNWPSFRGPNASGVAEGTNPPTTWDVEKSQNPVMATPALSPGMLIVRVENVIYALGERKTAKN